jgi:MFS family permease
MKTTKPSHSNESGRAAGQNHPAGEEPGVRSRRSLVYLMIVATAGWALAAFDFNLLVLALNDIAKGLHLSSTLVGSLGMIIYAAMLIFSVVLGYAMDQKGRRWAWMVALGGAAIFTGLTFFVQNFWELAAVRAIASGFAYAELAISVTLVNEELPARNRGLLYSIVQAGWPIGVVLASVVYLSAIHLGWRYLFLFGVPPLIVVVIGRLWIKEPERWLHLKEVREALKAGDDQKVALLRKRYDVAVGQAKKTSFAQLFSKDHADVRRQLIVLSLVWFFYGCSYVATNSYILYFLTKYRGFSSDAAADLFLVCAAVGIGFYVFGGWLGEKYTRRTILIVTGAMVAPLALAFSFARVPWEVYLIYFLLYQATNGTWSGVAYTYNAESFPTRIRGTATGFLDAVQIVGFIVGSAVWTALVSRVDPQIVWIVVAVVFALGQWIIIFGRKIPPNQTLEQITI